MVMRLRQATDEIPPPPPLALEEATPEKNELFEAVIHGQVRLRSDSQ